MKNGPSIGILLMLGVLSCTKGPGHHPVYPIKGRVLYEGKPAAGAVVILHTDGDMANASRPRGRADAEGEFELTTYRNGDGAPVGSYVVTVEWKRADDHPEQGMDLLPPVYRDPKRSKLRANVTSDTNEPLLLLLKAKP